MDFAWIAGGVLLLYLGGEALVRHASGLARAVGLSPLVIGLTVVAFGTSAPELAASLTAALRGTPELAFANVVGSNIANLGLILAVAALILPISATARFLRREMPFLIGTSALLVAMAANGTVSRLEGLLLVALLVGYLGFLLLERRESPSVEAEFAAEYGSGPPHRARNLAGIALGIALLTLGADALVTGAVGVARALGLSERVIGLTLVALGTSLPELASTVVAASRREGDIVLGNLVGSNIFNILGILGITALVRPLSIDAVAVRFDLAAMLIVSLLVWPFLTTRKRLERWEGAVLLAVYGAYLVFLFR